MFVSLYRSVVPLCDDVFVAKVVLFVLDFVCARQRAVQHDQVTADGTDGCVDGRPSCRGNCVWT